MPTVPELAGKLRKPLERELLTGCTNRVVAGGVEKLLDNLARPFPQVRETLRGYAAMSEAERGEGLRAALALLGGAPVPAPATKPDKADGQDQDAEVSGLDRVADLGPGGAKKLAALGLRTLRDLLHFYPRKHEDRRALPNLQDVAEGEKVTVEGVVTAKSRRTPKPGMLILEATLQDAWGQKVRCTWFGQPWVERQLKEGAKLIVTGRARRFGRGVQVGVEYFEVAEGARDSLSTGRIVGVYDSKEGTSQAFLRRAAKLALSAADLGDFLDGAARGKYGLTDLPDALRGIHFPEDEAHLRRATERLRFDEYLFLELRMLLQGEEGVLLGKRIAAEPGDMAAFEASLPFQFTGAQRRVISEIAADMRGERQMARLIQGDVGSGKTAVAACALYLAARDGYQGALMAPTEILARQHFASLQQYLFPLGVRLGFLIGALPSGQKAEVQRAVRTGEIDVLVGTQALIQEAVAFHNLGLAVIDEEHRFGVAQRRKLLSGRPDVLVMSATPIPRSLALTAYGDLELSIIDELPPGRSPIETKLLQDTHRQQAYGFVMGQVREGRQAFVVASLIEESESLTELVAATQLAEDLKVLLPEARVGVLHGKMSAAEKDDVMTRFRAREFDLLVSTTVIEVGVDVPNATVMVIENAERFGLAQLHQLRGRVGRGAHQSYCVLIAGDHSKKTRARLKVIEGSADGFAIAEADLKLRGPGELRGTRQSGLPDLKLGDLVSDADVIERARELAKTILAGDPALTQPRHAALRRELQARSAQVAYREVI